jgi:ribosomal protein S18 acetylase RimI-like enzyme
VTVRLEPLGPGRFPAWAEESKRSFADAQVAAGLMPPADAAAYAEQQLPLLLPDGIGTPGQHIWTVHDGDAEVGHLWLRVQLEPDGWEAYVLDIALHPDVRGRGLGRATMLAAEAQARGFGARAVLLNVFGYNRPALRLYAGLGYRPTAALLARPLDRRETAASEKTSLRLEPMARTDAEEYRAALAVADPHHAQALLDGTPDAPAHEFRTAYDGDRPAGRIWLQQQRRSDGLQVLVRDLSATERDQPALLAAAERVGRDVGATSLAVGVYGTDHPAQALRALLEDEAGFGLTAQLMRKTL